MERIQKLIAQSGLCSRRKAEKLITGGRVKVNGRTVQALGEKASPSDTITVDGHPISYEDKVYYLLYKPEGYVSTVKDEKGRKTVKDLVPSSKRIYPVGRLDYDSSGVLLMTNDGDLTAALTHPRYNIEKEYEVTVNGFLRKETSRKIRRGITLEGQMTKPTKIRKVKYNKQKQRTKLNLVITEGKYHHIKKMFEHFDHEVLKLKRIRFAFLTLDDLSRGGHRRVKIHELKKLRVLIDRERRRAGAK